MRGECESPLPGHWRMRVAVVDRPDPPGNPRYPRCGADPYRAGTVRRTRCSRKRAASRCVRSTYGHLPPPSSRLHKARSRTRAVSGCGSAGSADGPEPDLGCRLDTTANREGGLYRPSRLIRGRRGKACGRRPPGTSKTTGGGHSRLAACHRRSWKRVPNKKRNRMTPPRHPCPRNRGNSPSHFP